jgi:hypothetical protein
VLLRMATDGAVQMDPEKEAAMDEGALLRKASEQQNAQWRLNEQRLKQLGVKKARARALRALRPRVMWPREPAARPRPPPPPRARALRRHRARVAALRGCVALASTRVRARAPVHRPPRRG